MTSSEHTLSEAQMEQFNQQGLLILDKVFDTREVGRMRVEADYIMKMILNASLANKRRSGRLDMKASADGSQVVRKIQPINDLSLYLSRISEDPRLIAPMRQIMGHDPILMEEKLNYKQPLKSNVEGLESSTGDDQFPIHNDWAYYAGNDYPQDVISSAISMDECTADNGPLHVWPGSHRQHLEHEMVPGIGLRVKPGLIDAKAGVDILAPAGSVMLFHALLVHNSRANQTRGPRRLMIYSHYPSRIDRGVDVRNGPLRLAESPWEEEYHRMKEDGLYQDQFEL